jgi:hypothetical protein
MLDIHRNIHSSEEKEDNNRSMRFTGKNGRLGNLLSEGNLPFSMLAKGLPAS